MIPGFTPPAPDQRMGAGARAIEYVLRGIARTLRERRGARRPAIVREVEAIIERRLATGLPRVGDVAAELGRSRQTLFRQLRTADTTFAALLEKVRRRKAGKMVREGKMAVKDIAYRLHFSDPAAFSRAFKRWEGLSPQAFRQAPDTGSRGSPFPSRRRAD